MVVILHRAELAEDALLDKVAVGVLGVAKSKGAETRPQRHHADQHAEVADPVDDESLVGRVRGALPLDVKTDQEVGANAHQFPKHEHHRHVSRDDNPQHAE